MIIIRKYIKKNIGISLKDEILYHVLGNEGGIGSQKLKSNGVSQWFHDEVPP